MFRWFDEPIHPALLAQALSGSTHLLREPVHPALLGDDAAPDDRLDGLERIETVLDMLDQLTHSERRLAACSMSQVGAPGVARLLAELHARYSCQPGSFIDYALETLLRLDGETRSRACEVILDQWYADIFSATELDTILAALITTHAPDAWPGIDAWRAAFRASMQGRQP